MRARFPSEDWAVFVATVVSTGCASTASRWGLTVGGDVPKLKAAVALPRVDGG
ncbi:hypothetical protein E4U61_008034, partial [Claviceps capensis]